MSTISESEIEDLALNLLEKQGFEWLFGLEQGFKRIQQKDCKNYGSSAPVLSGTKTSFRVQFKSHGDKSVQLDKISKKAMERITGKSGQKVRPKTQEKMTQKVTQKIDIKISDFLSKNPNLTISELAFKIGKSESTVKRILRKLQKEGQLKRIGADKGGYWKIIKKSK